MRVILGVGGGIAAYKAAELVRALQQRDHEVQVVMTRAAQEFIQPLTFAALTGRKVITGLFSQESSQGHSVERSRAYRGRARERSAGGGARHGRSAGEVRVRARRTIFEHPVSGIYRSSGFGAGHEYRHVGTSSHRRRIWTRLSGAAARSWIRRKVGWRAGPLEPGGLPIPSDRRTRRYARLNA